MQLTRALANIQAFIRNNGEEDLIAVAFGVAVMKDAVTNGDESRVEVARHFVLSGFFEGQKDLLIEMADNLQELMDVNSKDYGTGLTADG